MLPLPVRGHGRRVSATITPSRQRDTRCYVRESRASPRAKTTLYLLSGGSRVRILARAPLPLQLKHRQMLRDARDGESAATPASASGPVPPWRYARCISRRVRAGGVG